MKRVLVAVFVGLVTLAAGLAMSVAITIMLAPSPQATRRPPEPA